jgi:hypothetical protein
MRDARKLVERALVKYESPALFIRFGVKSAPLRENDSRASVREIGLDVNVTRGGQQESNILSVHMHARIKGCAGHDANWLLDGPEVQAAKQLAARESNWIWLSLALMRSSSSRKAMKVMSEDRLAPYLEVALLGMMPLSLSNMPSLCVSGFSVFHDEL